MLNKIKKRNPIKNSKESTKLIVLFNELIGICTSYANEAKANSVQ